MLEISMYRNSTKVFDTCDYIKRDSEKSVVAFNMAVLGLSTLNLAALSKGNICFNASMVSLSFLMDKVLWGKIIGVTIFSALLLLVFVAKKLFRKEKVTINYLLDEFVWIWLECQIVLYMVMFLV